MKSSDAPQGPEILNDADLEDITGGFEAWPAKWVGPQLTTDDVETAEAETRKKAGHSTPLLLKAVVENE